jgi:hypothetical protein
MLPRPPECPCRIGTATRCAFTERSIPGADGSSENQATRYSNSVALIGGVRRAGSETTSQRVSRRNSGWFGAAQGDPVLKQRLTGRGIEQPVSARFGSALVLGLLGGGSIGVDPTLLDDIRWSAEPVVDGMLMRRATRWRWFASSTSTTVGLAALDDSEERSIHDNPATAGRASNECELEEEQVVDRLLYRNPPKIG